MPNRKDFTMQDTKMPNKKGSLDETQHIQCVHHVRVWQWLTMDSLTAHATSGLYLNDIIMNNQW